MKDSTTTGAIDRRAFLSMTLLAGVGAAAVLLDACGGSSASASTSSNATAGSEGGASSGSPAAASPSVSVLAKPAAGGPVKLPNYIPLQTGPKPDLPGSVDGVIDAGFTSYPKNLFKGSPKAGEPKPPASQDRARRS